jgi:hypothetical protein
MDAETLKAEVFEPVANRVKGRAESLKHVRRFKRSGIEAWFKVEAVAALGDCVEKLQNKGPDLRLREVSVELKAATDFEPPYILGGLRFGTPCLFLGSSDDISVSVERLMKLLTEKGSRMLAHETFSDGQYDWIVGLIVPADYDPDATATRP